jgi:hypothetical protein
VLLCDDLAASLYVFSKKGSYPFLLTAFTFPSPAQDDQNSPPTLLSAFRDRGVPGPTSEMSPRAPAQMGRRETEREGGGSRREREVEISRPSCLSRAQVGCACSRGLQASTWEGSERPRASASPVLFPARPTLCKRALVLPFIGEGEDPGVQWGCSSVLTCLAEES